MPKLLGCDPINSKMFVAQDLSFKDDALHKTRGLGHVETWYYDAMLNNGYSFVTLINFIRTLKIGIAITSLYIYKDGKLIDSIRNQNSSKHFYGSKDKPLLILKGKEILKGLIEPKTGNWIFHVSLGNKNLGINLQLEKNSKAWMGRTYLGNWIVIPNFNVSGTIFLNGENISVKGEGYHDHNIYPVYAPFFNKGYIFGKIHAGQVDITWARVIKTRVDDELIIVINKEDKYFSIPQENINFVIEDYIKDHRKIVPTNYRLIVDNNKFYINIKIKSINFHHLSIPTVNYWRHHVNNIGEIKINSVSKKINNFDIAEQLAFL